MQKDIRLTLVPYLAMEAYFGIANICILHARWPAKESGLLILLRRGLDLTLGVECCLVKDYQS